MIYGLNFNNTRIPDALARYFRKEMVLQGAFGKQRVRLQGVCETEEEKHAMTLTANNGKRPLHWETRHTTKGDVFGFYSW